MWNLKYGTNEPVCRTERLRVIENRLVVARGGGGARDGWGVRGL